MIIWFFFCRVSFFYFTCEFTHSKEKKNTHTLYVTQRMNDFFFSFFSFWLWMWRNQIGVDHQALNHRSRIGPLLLRERSCARENKIKSCDYAFYLGLYKINKCILRRSWMRVPCAMIFRYRNSRSGHSQALIHRKSIGIEIHCWLREISLDVND